ncbi:type VII secretion protein EccB, partial [Mycolicibacterium vaccae]|nr:type VII secretion protein EccB [Mycolicibacterium vaccae]
ESRDAPEHAQPAPWPILSLLPPGPRLSQEAAMIAHDGMAADPRASDRVRQRVLPPRTIPLRSVARSQKPSLLAVANGRRLVADSDRFAANWNSTI